MYGPVTFSLIVPLLFSLPCIGLPVFKTKPPTSPNEVWRLVCGRDRLPVPNILVSVTAVGQTKNWNQLETKSTDNQGHVSLATRPSKNEDFIVKIIYNYEPVVDQGDETPFSVAHENDTLNEDSALTEEILLDDDIRKSGNITLTDVPCLAYVNTKRALEDFRTVTGRKGHPAGSLRLVFSKHIGETLGQPFSTANTILLPIGYRTSYNTALHEIGHTLRYSLDGSYGHFLGDLAKYAYTQPHSCKQKTNPGFAFNEGWAKYWANDTNCFVGHDWAIQKHLSVEDEFSIEGRVASALTDLGNRCHGPQHRKRFYELLEQNPLSVHTYKEFVKLHQKKYNCGN